MKKLIVSLMVAVVVILLGCNVWLSLELVDVLQTNKELSNSQRNQYSGWKSLGWVGEQGGGYPYNFPKSEPASTDIYSGWTSKGWVGEQGKP